MVKSLSRGSGGKKEKNLRALQWPPGWRPPEPQPNSHSTGIVLLPGGPDFGWRAALTEPKARSQAGARRRRLPTPLFSPSLNLSLQTAWPESHAARRASSKAAVESPQDRADASRKPHPITNRPGSALPPRA